MSPQTQPTTFSPGVRVARGPDWIWQNQDGGEGHVGTVCEIGRFGSTHSPEKTVVVNWDSGHRTNYRVGYQGQYDLVVIDNAQIGVKHPNIICNGCSKAGIAGIRFRCAQCANFDLCATCYGADVHDLDHSFVRYQTINSVGVRVPTRQSSTKLQLRGIFVGAKVVRGPDWEWGQQDGGDGKTGRVMEIRGWDNESCRSVANVSWVSGSTNVYRLGHKGNVDLKYLQAAVGGAYYRDHMPVLGQTEEQQPVTVTSAAARPTYAVGDIVKVCLERDALMHLQQGHGGWNPRMAEYLNKVGTVHRITDKGDIRVQYDGCSNRWTFHPSALVKVCTFHVGDLVTIINDAAKVQQLQKGHGEWVDTMMHALNKTGKVIKVYADGDLRIQQIDDGFAWTLNPKCVKLERSTQATATEWSNSMMDLSHQRSDPVMVPPLSGLSGSSAADKLVREAAQGRMEYVQQYLAEHPYDVDVMSAGKTCLQVAAHQGHVQLVQYLLRLKANVNVVDKEGDSTLHYAAFGNQPEIMRILLQSGADINVLNASHCSALHISAHKRPPHCVEVLLENGADVNAQDTYGDTALHDAIGKENVGVIELLCAAPALNLNVRNNRGFNALHHASLKGSLNAAKRILQKSRELIDVKKDDGFAALHLAALNGHSAMVEILVKDGQANIDIRNNRQQTPFLLAVSQGHASAIERLVQLGCDVTARDEDGDNAMHLCVIKKSNLVMGVNQHDAPQIWEINQGLVHIMENRLMCAILCFLLKSGCKIEANNKGQNILDWVWDKTAQELIMSYVNPSASSSSSMRPAVSTTSTAVTSASTSNHSYVSSDQIYSNVQSIGFQSQPTPQRRMLEENTAAPSSSSSGGAPFVQYVDENSSPPTAVDNRQQPRLASLSPSPGTTQTTHSPALPEGSTANSASAINTSTEQNQLEPNEFGNRQPGRKELNQQPAAVPSSSTGTNKIINIVASATALPPTIASTSNDECIVCNEPSSLTRFEPCGHQISCAECSVRMKKCLSCGVPIERRLSQGGHERPAQHSAAQLHQLQLQHLQMQLQQQERQPSVDRLRYLEDKILEIEETHCCSICMEQRRNVAFLCGHSACSKCAETLKTCHMCRKSIVKKINLY